KDTIRHIKYRPPRLDQATMELAVPHIHSEIKRPVVAPEGSDILRRGRKVGKPKPCLGRIDIASPSGEDRRPKICAERRGRQLLHAIQSDDSVEVGGIAFAVELGIIVKPNAITARRGRK